MLFLVVLLVCSGVDINVWSLNGFIFFYSVVVCFVSNVYWFLMNLGCDIFVIDSEGLIVLYYVVKDVFYVGLEYFVDLYVSNLKGWIEN